VAHRYQGFWRFCTIRLYFFLSNFGAYVFHRLDATGILIFGIKYDYLNSGRNRAIPVKRVSLSCFSTGIKKQARFSLNTTKNPLPISSISTQYTMPAVIFSSTKFGHVNFDNLADFTYLMN